MNLQVKGNVNYSDLKVQFPKVAVGTNDASLNAANNGKYSQGIGQCRCSVNISFTYAPT